MITIEPPSTISNSALFWPRLTRTLTRACLATLLAITISAHAQPSPTTKEWQLTWSDEFNAPNGTPPPDPAKWNIVTGGKGYGNEELETYTSRPINAHQEGGNLVITAQKEDLIGPDVIPRHYTSARINTQNHFAQKYGRFEARIKLPTGKGIWPAFWLLGDDHESSPWPDCGEIDILETIGAPDTMYSTIHGPGYSGAKGLSTKFVLPPSEAVDTAFHIYAVEWAPNDLKFFFDDHLIIERTPADLPPNTKWVYDHSFYILLNLAVGGNWPGSPDASTTFPQQMLVDYVHVYSRKSAPPVAATTPGAPSIDSDVWASSEGRPLSSISQGSYTSATTEQVEP
jgi:beta-glucanase (GH16 family)